MTITDLRARSARIHRAGTADTVIVSAIATGSRHWFGRSATAARARIDAMTTREQIRAERRAQRRSS